MYLTKNGEGDLVVMDIEAFACREKILKSRDKLEYHSKDSHVVKRILLV